ncbi:hypothetical protein OPU39_07710, partial [Acinetobacter nosocomialis]|nr:hypothetical protein [Acinetobacter nosocomialis]
GGIDLNHVTTIGLPSSSILDAFFQSKLPLLLRKQKLSNHRIQVLLNLKIIQKQMFYHLPPIHLKLV